MARKMHINRLDKDELEYELTVRGIALGNCEEMRLFLNYAEPSSRRGNVLEKDLAFIEVTEDISSLNVTPTSIGSNKKEIVCFRCKKPGHKAIGCAMPGGKRAKTYLNGGDKYVDPSTSTNKFQPILDFILDHAQNDQRPYLKVSVFGRTLLVLGLLDSGASSTILGSKGWQLMRDLNIPLDMSRKVKCTIANGQSCESIGECEILISVRDRLKLIKVLVVLELAHTLILGANFWRCMGIIPDLRHNEWHFSNQPTTIDSVDHLRSQTVLTSLQEARLQALIDRNVALMGGQLGCTDMAEHGKELVLPDMLSRSVPVIDVVNVTASVAHDKWYEHMVAMVTKTPLKYPNWRVCDELLYKYVRPSYVELSVPSDCWKQVVQRLDKAAKKNERTYNLRRRCKEFLPNQLVWKKNFTLSDASKFYTTHCVSDDLKMNNGIAKDFKKRFRGLEVLIQQKQKPGGLAGKPSLRTMWMSWYMLRNYINTNQICKLAIPRLGCGLDQLSWKTVKNMVCCLFKEVEVDIIVRNWTETKDVLGKIKVLKGSTVGCFTYPEGNPESQGIVLYVEDTNDMVTLEDHQLDHLINISERKQLAVLLQRLLQLLEDVEIQIESADEDEGDEDHIEERDEDSNSERI
ncbi:hypothetical protein NQ314_006214 [Rhamnusium bicolor]|uniref:CCHC-type domain-containing protein n=1 Tax=Rhamnusium bicolor TaxID=1586634 RepID=A0AAV8Z649_9CUCU|nr:hypothetical protein NQ314_006214 [Rhamnusium bicolor]